MNQSRCILSVVLSLAFSFSASAADVQFENLNKSDFQKIIGDFSANFMHTSVMGAGTLGDIWGFEVGLVGGVTKTPEIDKFAKEANPGSKAEQFPHAEILGVVTVPFAFTLEAGLIPKVGGEDFKASSFSLAAKWTPSELFFELPVDLAIKLQTTKSTANFKGDVNSVATSFDFENNIFAATALVGKNFVVFEPYAGVGMASAKGDLSVTGSTQVFESGYATSSASEKKSSTFFLVGSEAKLGLVKFGLEYTHLFDTSRLTGKFSFYF